MINKKGPEGKTTKGEGMGLATMLTSKNRYCGYCGC